MPIGSSGSYLNRIVSKTADMDTISYSKFNVVDYKDHKFVMCTVDLDMFHIGTRLRESG